ncbi:MAG: HlyD family efflux transporter periplasmic adaptor subunit [Anaerolineae bacterium]|nr:HlyD family efflux transporter periplasmic adaptor subunit [Anaerolineae bacterium]
MNRIIRIGITVLILSVVVVIAFQFVQYQRTAAQDTSNTQDIVQDEATVVLKDLSVTVSATGPLSPARQVALVFELSAPVREILIEEAQAVKVGDLLARLDTTDLDSALTNAQIALQSQQVAYEALTAPPREVDIAAAQAAVTVAQAQAGSASLGADANQVEIARLQAEIARNQLWQAQLQRDAGPAQIEQIREQAAELGIDSGIGAPPDPADTVTPQIKQAENGVQLADVSLSGVENQPADVAALSAANAQLVAAQAQLDLLINGPTDMQLQIVDTQLQMAQLALDSAQATANRALLTAPFDGIIAANNLKVGEAPPANNAAMHLIDTSTYFVDVAVDETDIVKLQVGQKVNLKLDALPDADITGVVTRVAVTPVRSGQLVTYTVRVTLDPTTERLRVGMTATATIVVNELQDVPTIPNRFIRIDRATQQAYVTIRRTDGGFEEIPVVLGVRSETDSQVVSGIAAGQQVVLLPRGSFNPIG